MSALKRQLEQKTCPPHEAIGLALAEDLGQTGCDEARERIGELAETLPAASNPKSRLAAMASLNGEQLRPSTTGAFLLPRALYGGHPAGVAIAAAAVASRVGYGIGLVGHNDRLYLAHPQAGVVIVDPAMGELVDARDLGVDLNWRCPHEAAAVLLGHIVRRAVREGDIALGLTGTSLRLSLPVDSQTRTRFERDHNRLLARLN